MTDKGSEEELVANAVAALANDEEVLAAGMFGCQDLVKPQVEGQMAGGIVGSMVTHSVAGSALGLVLGGMAAKKAAAESKGMTLKLVVGVTPTMIHVLNWGEGDEAEREVATFHRATTDVKIKKRGLSRTIDLHDTTTDAHIYLHAATGMAKQSGPDKEVLTLLEENQAKAS